MKDTKSSAEMKERFAESVTIPRFLIPGKDYGFINKNGKPILFKAGAEKILSALKLHIESLVCVSNITDIDRNFLDFTYRCSVKNDRGVVTGISEGSSNSREECFGSGYAVKDVNLLTKEEYRQKMKCGEGRWVRKNDKWLWTERAAKVNVIGMKNFIQKTAQRRALVGAVLMAAGLSDSFKQD